MPRVHTVGKRLKLIEKCLENEFFAENWAEALRKMARSKFLLGENKREWKASFEWFLDPVNVENILAGKYDNKKKTDQAPDYERKEI